MPPIVRQQVVRSWVIRQPPIKAIACNVLSETIGSVRNVHLYLMKRAVNMVQLQPLTAAVEQEQFVKIAHH